MPQHGVGDIAHAVPLTLRAIEERTHQASDLAVMRLEREVTGVEQMDFRIGIVAAIGLRTRWEEERVMLPPDRQRRRPILSEIRLKCRVKRDVGTVAQDQVSIPRRSTRCGWMLR